MVNPCHSCSEGYHVPKDVKYGANGTYHHAGCTAVNMQKMGFTATPEKLCGCYAKNPDIHKQFKDQSNLT